MRVVRSVRVTTYANVPGDSRCECTDAECPVHPHPHNEDTRCPRKATCVLFRTDMDDYTGVALCDPCAEDALDSDLFAWADDFEDEDFDDNANPTHARAE